MLTDSLLPSLPVSARAPLVRELPCDLETPASVYLKLRGQGPSFLLESVTGGERLARYSFVGLRPSRQYRLRGGALEVIAGGQVRRLPVPTGRDPLHLLQAEMAAYAPPPLPGLPRFVGGLVGYLGFECVRYFEPRLAARLTPGREPEAMFMLADTLVAFDHLRHTLQLIVHALDGDLEAAGRRLDEVAARLRAPLPLAQATAAAGPSSFEANLTPEQYQANVRAAKAYIEAGDAFQVVPSQRLTRRTSAEPFAIYRALRRLNPSPYMYFFDFGEVDGQPFYLAGASPEMFVRLEGRRASLCPIAGTRPRGADAPADAALEQELLADPKEQAEHVMLVDLGRNDLGRVCTYGSIRLPVFMVVERYSHVMHLVSRVEGELRPGLTAFDLVRAAFPAGTVTGAPKVRAMEIIRELERAPRGPYAGAVGYFSFDGAMDTCLCIRTLVGRGPQVTVQAGGGVVLDSDPAREHQESLHKAQAVLRAVEMAEAGG